MELNSDMYKFDNDFDPEDISYNIRRGVYKFIGAGSGRVVFDMKNGYVVKAARNQKGIAQNKAEYNISLSDDSGLFARIAAVFDDYEFLVMEKASRIRDITYVWKHFNVRNNKELFQLQQLQYISSRYNIVLKDLGRSVNWGKINDKPVIIDYGFTKEVRKNYYLPPIYRNLRR